MNTEVRYPNLEAAVEKAVEMKRKAESEIADIIERYEQETGLKINSVSLETIFILTHEKVIRQFHVNLKAEL